MVGGLIMAHGDDSGLRVPPRLAHVQVVVLAVRDDDEVIARCRALTDELVAAGVRAQLDVRTDISFGRRATDWELKGVPVRLELGPRDLANGEVTMARRISGDKAPAQLAGIAQTVRDALDAEQDALLAEATARRTARTADVDSLDDARAAAESGWARLPWDKVGTEGEAELATSGITVRCLTRADGSLPSSEQEPDLVCSVARAY
jgi:prolyl-tRNA synthetase